MKISLTLKSAKLSISILFNDHSVITTLAPLEEIQECLCEYFLIMENMRYNFKGISVTPVWRGKEHFTNST